MMNHLLLLNIEEEIQSLLEDTNNYIPPEIIPAETTLCLREYVLNCLDGCAENGVIQNGLTIPYDGQPYDSK